MTDYVLKGLCIPLYNIQFQNYLLLKLKEQNPAKILLVDVESQECITSGELQTKYIKLACSLKTYLENGDTIALVSENTSLSILPVLASLYLGSTIGVVNPAYVTYQLRRNFICYKPKIVFCCKDSLENVLKVKEEVDFIKLVVVISTKDIDNTICINNFIENNCNVSDVHNFEPVLVEDINQTAIILSSSGTTGITKSERYLDLNASTVSIVVIPIFHIFGLFLMLFGVVSSSKSVILKKFSPDTFLETLQKYAVQKLNIVPAVAVFLAKTTSLNKYNLFHLDDILCGGAPLKQDILTTLEGRLKIKIRQVYGCTEAGVVSLRSKMSKKENTCGEVVPHMQVKVREIETNEALPPYRKGELCVKGPGITKGYVNDEQSTQEAFDEEGYLKTGDIGYYDEEGDLFIVDRLKDIIKYKGCQIAPAEIENVLLKHPTIKDAAVVGVPDEYAGELPKIFIVTEPEEYLSEQDIITFLAEYVSSYMYFRNGVHFIDAIPKSATGSTLKQNLRELCSKK